MKQKDTSSFWDNVLSPVTSICVALTMIGVGKHSSQGGSFQGSSCEDAGKIAKNATGMHDKGLSSLGCGSRSKTGMIARKYKPKKEEEGNVLTSKQAKQTDKEDGSQRKKIRELEKKILLPFITAAENQSCYLISNSENDAEKLMNNNCQSPIETTRRISVQSIDSCENPCSSKTGTGLEDIPTKKRTVLKSLSSTATANKHGDIGKQRKFENPVEWPKISPRYDSLDTRFQGTAGGVQQAYVSRDKELLPKQSRKGVFVNLGGPRSIENDKKLRIHLTLPGMEGSIRTEGNSGGRSKRGRKTLPKITSNFSTTKDLQNIVYTDDRSEVHLVDYTNLTEGYKKTKRRSKMKGNDDSQFLTTCDNGRESGYSHDKVLTSRPKKKREKVGKRTKDGKQKETRTFQYDLPIEFREDAVCKREIKSIMKNGNSHNRNSSKDRMQIRRVSFSKKTIRTFVPDGGEITMK